MRFIYVGKKPYGGSTCIAPITLWWYRRDKEDCDFHEIQNTIKYLWGLRSFGVSFASPFTKTGEYVSFDVDADMYGKRRLWFSWWFGFTNCRIHKPVSRCSHEWRTEGRQRHLLTREEKEDGLGWLKELRLGAIQRGESI